jgi:hypothetical protein
VPVRNSPARLAPVDNRLALMDQAFFAAQHAAGQQFLIQCVWVYEHAVDLAELRRFHHNLGHGLLGRRIERSPLPFGRHRWVLDRGPKDIDFEDGVRPRAEVSDWADERLQIPADAEYGPGWHLGVTRLTDGSTAISLVSSHELLDGIGLVLALADAVLGKTRELDYPAPGSSTRLRAIGRDARQAAREVPQVGRALVAAAKLARRSRREGVRPPAPQPVAVAQVGGDEPVFIPAVSISVDLNEWDARAKALGGTRNTLAAGLAAKLGELTGRLRKDDGAVTLQLPVTDRTETDTRAIAVSYARVTIDPTRVTTDLSEARATIKQALSSFGETPNALSQLMWLTPWTSQRALKRMSTGAAADPDLPVVLSNLGDVGLVVARIDGTEAEYATARGATRHATRQWLERTGGQLRLQYFRTGSRVVISVVSYRPGAENTRSELRELAERTLAEFDLCGQVE